MLDFLPYQKDSQQVRGHIILADESDETLLMRWNLWMSNQYFLGGEDGYWQAGTLAH